MKRSAKSITINLKALLIALFVGNMVVMSQSIMTQFPQDAEKDKVFIENKGQVYDQHSNARPDVLFSGQQGDLVFHLRQDGISYQLYQILDDGEDKETLSRLKEDVSESLVGIHRIDLNWIEPLTTFSIETGQASDVKRNFYNGLNEDGITGIVAYDHVIYQQLFEGIDLKWYMNENALEYDFIVQPNAETKNIRWNIEGADKVYVDDLGRLAIQTPMGTIFEEAPIAFQGGASIEASWDIDGGSVGIHVSEYDASKLLIIDPVIRVWGTYLGGTGDDQINSGRSDDNSNLYVAGSTFSLTSIATSGSHQDTIAGLSDAFISKFDSSGNLLWSTYYGSIGTDFGEGCAVDGSSSVYLTGITQSGKTLGTSGSHQPAYGGGFQDAFLVKFNSSGVRQWATYYGGKDQDRSYDCAVDMLSNVYIGGYTLSDSGISTVGSHQVDYKSGDAFLVKFSSNGVRQWATYYGDSAGSDAIHSIETKFLDVYITGVTGSYTNIASSGAHQTSLSGLSDAFVAKFNTSGSRTWGTYFGGSDQESAYACNIDDSLNVYIAGYTTSQSGLATNDAHQSSFAGGFWDSFLAKFDASGVNKWATYYGGNGIDAGYDLVTDSMNVYLAGVTFSSKGMATKNSQQTKFGGDRDAYIAKFNNLGRRIWGSYYGGSGWDYGTATMMDGNYNIYMAGRTKSSSNISTSGSHQSNIGSGGQFDGFLVRFEECLEDSVKIDVTVCDELKSPSGMYTWNETGIYYDTVSNMGGCDSIIRVNLTVQNTFSNIDVTSCNSYTTPSGNHQYFQSGIYNDTLMNAVGCDSVLTIDLSIRSFNLDVYSDPPLMTSMEESANYQWYRCDGPFTLIPGATSRQYTAQSNGRYAVVLSDSLCTDTSDCVEITGVGMDEAGGTSAFRIYPNPVKDQIHIISNAPAEEFRLMNMYGSIVDMGEVRNQEIDLKQITDGIYFLHIRINDTWLNQRIVVRY